MMPQKPKKAEGLDFTETEDGFAVFDPTNGKVHFLNNTGVIILEMCDGTYTCEEIIGIIEATFKVKDITKEEIRSYIKNLYNEHLLE